MTMLLVTEAIDGGILKMDDIVCASEKAKSMGGSTIFLDTGEEMSVHDLLKGIAVASGNDACVAIAEHIAGSEEAFVKMMNSRAKELGMENTNFVNSNGLDDDNHLTTAYDVALMSRELLKHEKIFEFTTIWTDTLRGGAFDLANTNKLVRFYKGANGLKTGSTSKAKFCVSATAKRDGMQLIAVIMASDTSDKRFASARALLDFGFANYSIIRPAEDFKIDQPVKVKKGVSDIVMPDIQQGFETLVEKARKNDIESKIELKNEVTAPVRKGDMLGKIIFFLDGKHIGECKLTARNDVPRKTLFEVYSELLTQWLR
jgi:D-alanyl-D-alanine carboxypeptidase (penicillin-binding protein 5/6)